jgi:hypothetical protein
MSAKLKVYNDEFYPGVIDVIKIRYHHIVRIVDDPHRVKYCRKVFDRPDPDAAEAYYSERNPEAQCVVCVNIFQA